MKQHFRLIIALLLSGAISAALAEEHSESARYWVYFRDKGIAAEQMQAALDGVSGNLTPRARARRIKEMPTLVDELDLPVHSDYVTEIGNLGVRNRRVSRWLNAVSVEALDAQVAQLRRLSFVRSVERFRLQAVVDPMPSRTPLDVEYGLSLFQNEMHRIPELHARGLSGRGVLMCMIDTGTWLEHECFDSLNIVATYDFIFGDTIVHYEAGQDSAGEDFHGTVVLSVLAGYRDSILIGPAYGAELLVAKSEWTYGETRQEEDNYVAAVEWADSLGASITSSSLGYIGRPPDFWYDFEDLDGHTAVTTRALAIAASRGILCVTAAGNEGNHEWGRIITPGDADSILTVGAVYVTGEITYFSGRGPTADGRIKPDVCALGHSVIGATTEQGEYFPTWSGTSMATPIVAGVAALVMEAHPDWTAQDVRRAIMNTASMHDSANNEYGWGIVDAVAAVDFDLGVRETDAPVIPNAPQLIQIFPNPVNGNAVFRFELSQRVQARVAIYDVGGRVVFASANKYWERGRTEWMFDAENLASGFYAVRLEGSEVSASGVLVVVK